MLEHHRAALVAQQGEAADGLMTAPSGADCRQHRDACAIAERFVERLDDIRSVRRVSKVLGGLAIDGQRLAVEHMRNL
jgi:hypothetical protein